MKIKRPIISILIFSFLMLAAMPAYAIFPSSNRPERTGTLIALGAAAVVMIVLQILDESESSEMSDESSGLNKLPLNMKIGLGYSDQVGLGYSDQDSYRGDSLKNLTPMLQMKLRF